jgi:hypothetical protein
MKIIPLLAFAALIMTASCTKNDDTPAPDRSTASMKQQETGQVSPRENIIKKKKPVNDPVPKPL